MKRKIYQQLLQWKQEEKGRVALLIEGARRVGKSYIAEEFARREYKSYILIDFAHITKPMKRVFDDYLEDTPTFFQYLQTVSKTKLYERESLIIFDEIQKYPRARQAIKHLVADGRYDYIETGSLVSINSSAEDILVPSEERSLQMYSMDFEEFLWALDDELTMPLIRDCFEKKRPLGPAHRQAMDYFRQYLIVGGMPQVVKEYATTRDFLTADKQKRDVLSLYRKSIGRYAKGYAEKVRGVFDQIPGELQKHEKRFQLSSIEKGARYRNYETAFLWLQDAQITNTCYGVTEPMVGMRLRRDNEIFKCYMMDTGLLLSHAFDEKTIQGEELYQKILLDKLEINSGMLIENMVAQMLSTAGHKLYFYSCPSREDASIRMEIDFLVEKQTLTNRHNISPLEVKSGIRYTTSSLNKFRNKFAEQLAVPYIIHDGDYREKEGIVYLPFYMVPLL